MNQRSLIGLVVLSMACSWACSTKSATSDSGTPGEAGTVGAGGTSCGGGGGTSAAGSVLMHHNDLARDGVYVDPALNVTSLAVDTTFADAAVTGNVYAQPLYLKGVNGGPDQVIVATESNLVYAFNAATGAQTWKRSVGTAVSTGLPCGNIATGGNTLGITGTPVIDAQTRTIYLDAMTVDSTVTAKHFVHALDADTGAEQTQLGWPANGVDVNATANSGGTTFDSLVQNQRAALALVGGKVFIPYSGHVGDCDGYHGWVVGISAVSCSSTPPTVNAWATLAIAGGIWGASGIASDGTSLFFATGNSKSSASAGPNTSSGDNNMTSNWLDSETVYKFPTSLAAPAMATGTDYFVPSNWIALDDADADIGGTGPMLVNVPGAPALVVALGKDGNAYLLNRSNLGGYGATPLAIKQVSGGGIINAAVAYTTAMGTYVVFKGAGSGCPSGQTGGLTAIRIVAGSTATAAPTMSIAWCGGPSTPKTGTVAAVTSYSPAVSMTTTTPGPSQHPTVWTIGSNNTLYALDGDVGTTISTATFGPSTVQAIQTPIIANGRVFVASNTQVYAFTP
jgi:outer membrane protein assembly factor BamB